MASRRSRDGAEWKLTSRHERQCGASGHERQCGASRHERQCGTSRHGRKCRRSRHQWTSRPGLLNWRLRHPLRSRPGLFSQGRTDVATSFDVATRGKLVQCSALFCTLFRSLFGHCSWTRFMNTVHRLKKKKKRVQKF